MCVKFQSYWNLTIKLFNTIIRTFIDVGDVHFCRDAVGVFCSPSRLGCLSHGCPYKTNLFTLYTVIFIIIIFALVGTLAQRLECSPNGPGDLGSIPGRVIPKTLKMVLDTTLLNTQHYKVRFKGKVEQSWEWSSALPYTLV